MPTAIGGEIFGHHAKLVRRFRFRFIEKGCMLPIGARTHRKYAAICVLPTARMD
ncbi:MAG TPA: hypothetical protein VNE59_15345 [Burkholderiales bacterium]|nr:hypothetical protein [Burkholderiales bacterium]